MVTAAGISSATYFNEQIAFSPASEYYVAHLLLLPDEPGPSKVTPFYFVSLDLCETAAYLKVILDTAPSLHGYAKDFHRQNYIAANLHRFSYFLAPCYARNFTHEYSHGFGSYLAKIVFMARNVPLNLLDSLQGYSVPPLVIASTPESLKHAKDLGLPCSSISDVKAEELNEHIRKSFSTVAPALDADQRLRLRRGEERRWTYLPTSSWQLSPSDSCLVNQICCPTQPLNYAFS
jgi:hypothetical protein